MRDSVAVDASANAQLTTLDSTSHNWSFSIDTLGDASSVLYDVAIISEDDIWAAGELYLRDSTGQIDPIPYNAARWNGSQWSLLRILVPIFCGSNTFPSATQAVFAFAQNDVWIASGITIMRWNGSTFTSLCIPQNVATGTINKMWGTSRNSVYCVGNNGTIAYYNGSTWQRIESGTTAIMVDVGGYTEPSEENSVVFTVAGATSSDGAKILSLSPTGVHDTLSPPSERLGGIWLSNKSTLYVCGLGIWRYKQTRWRQLTGLPSSLFFIRSVRGSAENNIFAIAGWTMMHFNGMNWHEYTELPADFRYQGLAVSQNTIVAVGFTVSGFFADRAAVVIGRLVP